MDAKVDDWVVTPRRGKAVEINALWYNALCLLAGWTREHGGGDGLDLAGQAARARRSFNERFWYAEGGLPLRRGRRRARRRSCLPAESGVRDFPRSSRAGSRSRWAPVHGGGPRAGCSRRSACARWRPASPDYKAKYYGDLRSRDAAYHQGTVWGWLIGPFVDAWLKLHPDERAGARQLLAGFEAHLDEACVGSISEIFDADDPYTPRGCVAQAWSVAEVLRVLAKTRVAG